MINLFCNLIEILRGERYYWDVSFLWGATIGIYWVIAAMVIFIILGALGIINLPK